MHRHRIVVRASLLILLLLGAVAGFAGRAVAQDATPAAGATIGGVTVLPPDALVEGLSLGEWAARQWQWSVTFPEAVSPSFDSTGERCGYGQHGPVFFVPGVFGITGSESVTCAVPTGVHVFVPIAGTECSTVEPPPFFGRDEAELAACAAVSTDIMSGTVAIDGQDVGDLSAYRAVSPMFTMNFPEGNFFGVPSGPASSVSDGYAIMLAPLEPGEYELTVTSDFGDGTVLAGNFRLVVQDPVVVEPAATPAAGEGAATPAA